MSANPLTIIGQPPLDPELKALCELFFRVCDMANVEIEAKLGIISQLQSDERLVLPLHTEVLLSPIGADGMPWFRFESNVGEEVFKYFNRKLNEEMGVKKGKIGYKHSKTVDSFHTVNSRRLRVSKDEHGKTTTVDKQRIHDLNFLCPGYPLDFRVSVSVETPITEEPTGAASSSRGKDRLSYTYDCWSIDLTKVESSQNGGTQTTFEVEIECTNMRRVQEEAKKAKNGGPNELNNICKGLLANLRILNSLAKSLHMQKYNAQHHGAPAGGAGAGAPPPPAPTVGVKRPHDGSNSSAPKRAPATNSAAAAGGYNPAADLEEDSHRSAWSDPRQEYEEAIGGGGDGNSDHGGGGDYDDE